MDKLKPCPFCGGEAIIEQTNDNKRRYYVQCRFGVLEKLPCPAARIRMWDYKNQDEAIKAWNRRENNDL